MIKNSLYCNITKNIFIFFLNLINLLLLLMLIFLYMIVYLFFNFSLKIQQFPCIHSSLNLYENITVTCKEYK
uniref:CSON012249 protein n=1 Tax=Culicoides sonorensis TaxID=179676 RepID=A0A336MAH2_CULSO